MAVIFTTNNYTHLNSALLETVEAFSYIALYMKLIFHTPDLVANLTLASAYYLTSFTKGILAMIVLVLP